MYFIELERFGWNWLTFSFTVLFVITTIQYYVSIGQAKRIWSRRSAQSLSLSMTSVMFFIYLAAFVYGLLVRSLTIAYTGGLFIPYLFITLGAWKFGKPLMIDWIYLWIGIVGIILFLAPIHPAWIFSGFTVAALIAMGLQISMLYEIRKRGVIHGGVLVMSAVKNIALLIFAYSSRDIVYMWSTPLYLGLSLWMALLWFSCDKEKPSITP